MNVKITFYTGPVTMADARLSSELLAKECHRLIGDKIKLTSEMMPEFEDHETDSSEPQEHGLSLTGIHRPPPAKKYTSGDRIGCSFSPNLNCEGCAGKRDMCIRTDCKHNTATLIHEFIHGIGEWPDGNDGPNAKPVDDWNREKLQSAINRGYIP